MTARRARGDCRSAARGQGSAKDSAFTGITVRPALFEQGKIHKGVGTENVSSTSGLKNLRDEQMEADFWQDKFPTVCGLSRNSYRRCVQQTRGSFAQTFLSSDSGALILLDDRDWLRLLARRQCLQEKGKEGRSDQLNSAHWQQFSTGSAQGVKDGAWR